MMIEGKFWFFGFFAYLDHNQRPTANMRDTDLHSRFDFEWMNCHVHHHIARPRNPSKIRFSALITGQNGGSRKKTRKKLAEKEIDESENMWISSINSWKYVKKWTRREGEDEVWRRRKFMHTMESGRGRGREAGPKYGMLKKRGGDQILTADSSATWWQP